MPDKMAAEPPMILCTVTFDGDRGMTVCTGYDGRQGYAFRTETKAESRSKAEDGVRDWIEQWRNQRRSDGIPTPEGTTIHEVHPHRLCMSDAVFAIRLDDGPDTGAA